MKRSCGFVILLFFITGTLASELDPEKRYTIIGNYVPIHEDSRDDTNDQNIEGDLSSTTIVVSQGFVDDGDTIFFEIGRGVISNERLVLEGEIDEPILARISVEGGLSPTLSAVTMLAPKQVVSFTLLDHHDPHTMDWLVLAGTLKLAQNPNKRFTIVGDLTGVDDPMPIVMIEGTKFDTAGNKIPSFFGTVLAEDKSFFIEGEIDEPRTVDISVLTHEGIFWGGTQAIVEPNAVISVVVSAPWAHELAATAGYGKHANVIGTWRLSKEYLATEALLNETMERVKTGRAIGEMEVSEAEYARSGKDITNETQTSEGEHGEARADSSVSSRPASALGCEHVVSLRDPISTEERHEIGPSRKKPIWVLLNEKLNEIRNVALQDIALNYEDPFNALLALELDPFVVLGDHTASDAALPIYDKLTTLLDEDIVANRVKPAREALALRLARETNHRTIVAGQKAPRFELPTLTGTQVSLSDTLNEAEYLYIDFWASWCGPCIDNFPVLKEVYSTYNKEGFELLTISVDATFEDWEVAANRLELPWLDLGSIGGMTTDVPVSYGIQHLPAGFLVDAKGCIVEKDMRPEQLKQLLEASYGERTTED